MNLEDTPSPCILVCVIDPASGFCFGCGRTGDEIGNWMLMGPSERHALTQQLPARLARLKRPPRRDTRRRRLARQGEE